MNAPTTRPTVEHIGVALPGGRLQLARAGQGEALLLVHGGYGSWVHWSANIEALAQRFQVLAPDLPGFGGSYDPGTCLMPEEQARVLLQLLDALGIERAHLAGFSFGALVAIHAGLLAPQRVRSLTLVNLPGVGPRSEDALAIPGRMSAIARSQGRRAAVAHNLRELMLCQHALVDEELVDRIAASIAATRYVTRSLSQQSQTLPLMAQLGCPVKVLLGERDPFHSNDLPGRQQGIDAALGYPAVQVVPGAAHWLQYDQPEAFNKVVGMAGISGAKSR